MIRPTILLLEQTRGAYMQMCWYTCTSSNSNKIWVDFEITLNWYSVNYHKTDMLDEVHMYFSSCILYVAVQSRILDHERNGRDKNVLSRLMWTGRIKSRICQFSLSTQI